MQKAIEEAKKFVCTTKDRIVKDAKEFIQNVDWKKVAIGVAGTLAVAAVVVATGGAAAPVLIGAAVGAVGRAEQLKFLRMSAQRHLVKSVKSWLKTALIWWLT